MTLQEQLADVVGRAHVLTDPEVCRPFGTDWTRRWQVTPRLVVRPGSVAEVQGVLRVCRASGTPVVTQGGNTGLVGGSVPGQPETVVLSTTRLRDLGPVDPVARQVTVGAGVTLAELRRHAAEAGLEYGVDLASRDAATVGGTVATNAGGLRVVRFGDTRAQVVGLQAVLADGSRVDDLGGLRKDSAGFSVPQLLVGSEGTLAAVTAVRVRLVDPLPADRAAVLVGVSTVAEGQRLSDTPGLLAAELITGDAMDLVCDRLDLAFPLRGRWAHYVLLEGSSLHRLPNLADADAVVDPRVWQYRERQTEAAATLGLVHKLDVAVPPDRLPELLDRLPSAWAPHRGFVFGHLAEANVHVEIVGPAADDDQPTERVLQLVASLGGTISAEHGVGRAKARWLGLRHQEGTLAAMRRIKAALDPDTILNPGVLLR